VQGIRLLVSYLGCYYDRHCVRDMLNTAKEIRCEIEKGLKFNRILDLQDAGECIVLIKVNFKSSLNNVCTDGCVRV
jgi:hypothetical protein